jgi:hypothetical protein
MRSLFTQGCAHEILTDVIVAFLGANRFDPLVLTEVCVINFLNFANFDLIFLHNTHILTVCLSVGPFAFLVCLCVCLPYVLYE